MSLEGITRLQHETPQKPPGRARARRRVWRELDTAAARWAAPWWALTWLLTFGRQGRLPWEWEELTTEEEREAELCQLEAFHGCRCGRIAHGSKAARGRRIRAWVSCPETLCSRLVWQHGPGASRGTLEVRTGNTGTR